MAEGTCLLLPKKLQSCGDSQQLSTVWLLRSMMKRIWVMTCVFKVLFLLECCCPGGDFPVTVKGQAGLNEL